MYKPNVDSMTLPNEPPLLRMNNLVICFLETPEYLNVLREEDTLMQNLRGSVLKMESMSLNSVQSKRNYIRRS